MELILLTVPDCPNAAVFGERLAAALADRSGVSVDRREIADERQSGTRTRCCARHAGRVRYEPADRAWFAALARFIPRKRWAGVFP